MEGKEIKMKFKTERREICESEVSPTLALCVDHVAFSLHSDADKQKDERE